MACLLCMVHPFTTQSSPLSSESPPYVEPERERERERDRERDRSRLFLGSLGASGGDIGFMK